jgi:hypothetical protein
MPRKDDPPAPHGRFATIPSLFGTSSKELVRDSKIVALPLPNKQAKESRLLTIIDLSSPFVPARYGAGVRIIPLPGAARPRYDGMPIEWN